MSIEGKRTVDDIHRKLGLIMWEHCGMARNNDGLEKAKGLVQQLRAEFWENLKVPGSGTELNQELEKAGRVADFLEFGELMARDALMRNESCGGHFRSEYQMPDGEAKRDDENFSYVAAWEFKGTDKEPEMHKEPLTFENVELAVRSYK
jgi:succinate dehydrogenase / fumarate reductase flavoprotein subunit